MGVRTQSSRSTPGSSGRRGGRKDQKFRPSSTRGDLPFSSIPGGPGLSCCPASSGSRRCSSGQGAPHLHPPGQQGHLLRRQGAAGRHLGPGVVDGPDEEAGCRILRIDRRSPTSAPQHCFTAGQAQIGLHGRLTAVAAEASSLQNGSDPLPEEGRRIILGLLRPNRMGPGRRQQRQHSQGPARQPRQHGGSHDI